MKNKILLYIAIAGFVGFLAAGLAAIRPVTNSITPEQSGSIVERGSVNVNSHAPVFSLPEIAGATIQLDDYLGKVVILNFWATWCAPCKEEMPVLDLFGLEHTDSLVILGIAVGESSETVRSFIEELNVNYPIMIDQTGVVGSVYHVAGYPTTYFIDGKGIIRGKYIGLLTPRILEQNLVSLGITK
jgi:thiol-disulfide isomerase/thioredoxin